MLFNDFQSAPGQPQFFLQRNVRIRHGTGTDHTGFSLGPQCLFQKPKRVFFDLDIFKGVLHSVAIAAGVAVNAAVLAAPVQIHSISCGQNSFDLNFMHPNSPLLYYRTSVCLCQYDPGQKLSCLQKARFMLG